MSHFRTISVAILVSTLAILPINSAFAAEDGKGKGKKGETCESAVDATAEAKAKKPAKETAKEAAKVKDEVSQTDGVDRTIYTLASFLEKDPAKNLAMIHPATIMAAAQKYAELIHLTKPHVVKDPLYRVKTIRVYPAFTGEMPGARGKMIVGQYEAIEELVKMLETEARGDRVGKMLLMNGPAGTGKTELLTVLDTLRVSLSNSSPDFAEYTYRWIGLEAIDKLAPLVTMVRGKPVEKSLLADMKRSPFTLLRPDIQDKVMDIVGADVQAKYGHDLTLWRKPDPKTAEIIRSIFEHEKPDIESGKMLIEDLTAEEYVKILSKYVRIVPRKREILKEANLIRALSDNPNYSTLFTAQSPRLMVIYPESSPLAYNYAGKVLDQDGGGLNMDEFFRNEATLTNTYLEVAQNRVVDTDVGPAVEIDAVPIATSNTESIEKARDNGAMLAILDRMHKVPMRLNLHPHEIAKTALLMIGLDKFSMRSLTPALDANGKPSTELNPIVPMDINAVYPIPDTRGMVYGAARRYAIYYNVNANTRVLISPQSMEMLGLTVAASRIVTDPASLKPFMSELQVLGPGHHYYLSVKARLDVMLGRAEPEAAVRMDLYKLKDLLKEGDSGISSRDIESWLKTALDMAVNRDQKVLTPETLDSAFISLLDRGVIAPNKKELRAAWLDRYRIVKSEFILEALYRDIRDIISGDGEKTDRIYDIVEKEMVALAADKNATEWQPDDGSGAQPINRVRLTKIEAIFLKQNGRELSSGHLLRHLSGAGKSGNSKVRNKELLDAINAYLVETEIDITEAAKQISDYYEGKNTDPNVQLRAAEAEKRFAQYGYDRVSFIQAMVYWNRLYYEKDRNARQNRR